MDTATACGASKNVEGHNRNRRLQGPWKFYGASHRLTVANTLADSISAPIVGVMGESWQAEALDRLKKAENDRIVMPYYDRDANITMPRK
jgi:hypothetical protein